MDCRGGMGYTKSNDARLNSMKRYLQMLGNKETPHHGALFLLAVEGRESDHVQRRQPFWSRVIFGHVHAPFLQ